MDKLGLDKIYISSFFKILWNCPEIVHRILVNSEKEAINKNLSSFIINNLYCNLLSGNYMENNLLFIITRMLKDEIETLDNINQVDKLENFLYDITGYKTNLVRFPGGSNQAHGLKTSIIDKLHNKGYKYVDWNCETGDGSDARLKQKDPYTWYKDTCSNKKIIVLLMHDYNYSTYTNLQKIIDDLKSKNYIFLPLNNKSIMAK